MYSGEASERKTLSTAGSRALWACVSDCMHSTANEFAKNLASRVEDISKDPDLVSHLNDVIQTFMINPRVKYMCRDIKSRIERDPGQTEKIFRGWVRDQGRSSLIDSQYDKTCGTVKMLNLYNPEM